MSPERAADRKEPAVFRAAAAFVLSELKLGTTDLLTVLVSLNGCGNCKLTDRVPAQAKEARFTGRRPSPILVYKKSARRQAAQ